MSEATRLIRPPLDGRSEAGRYILKSMAGTVRALSDPDPRMWCWRRSQTEHGGSSVRFSAVLVCLPAEGAPKLWQMR